jgi:antitoxin ParD1/3/4
MRVTLPDSAREFIERQAALRGFSEVGEFVMSLVREEHRRSLRAEVELSLLAASNSASSPMTAGDWEEIRRMGRAMISKRNQP